MTKGYSTQSYKFIQSSERFGYRPDRSYRLIMRQQPRQARLCSSKEKVDRRPIDPPPVVQICTDGDANDDEYLQNPNFMVYVSLLPSQDEYPEQIPPRRLAGTLVSSLHKLKDIDQSEKGFFIFPDISVRLEGRFRLRFNLYEIISRSAVHLCSVVSDVFTVYSPKLFPGMSESTALSRVFSDQGVRIRIRKDRPKNGERHEDTEFVDLSPKKRKASSPVLCSIESFPMEGKRSYERYGGGCSALSPSSGHNSDFEQDIDEEEIVPQARLPFNQHKSVNTKMQLSTSSLSQLNLNERRPNFRRDTNFYPTDISYHSQGPISASSYLPSHPRINNQVQMAGNQSNFKRDTNLYVSFEPARGSLTKHEDKGFSLLFDNYLRQQNIPHS